MYFRLYAQPSPLVKKKTCQMIIEVIKSRISNKIKINMFKENGITLQIRSYIALYL